MANIRSKFESAPDASLAREVRRNPLAVGAQAVLPSLVMASLCLSGASLAYADAPSRRHATAVTGDAPAVAMRVGGMGGARGCGALIPDAPEAEYVCAAGKTGPGCALTCDRGAGAACGFTEYCEADGRVTGLRGRRASLFQTGASEAAPRFTAWLASNPAALGLRGDVHAHDLEFERFDASAHGPFFIIRLRQKYRGLPLLGPEAVVVLSGQGEDVRLVNGSVVDGGVVYTNLDVQCPEALAAKALRLHAATSADEADQIALHELGLYAMPHSRRVVWAAQAAHDGVHLGLFAVDAAPVKEGELPKLVHVDRGVHAGLEDEAAIQVRGHDLSKTPYGLVVDLPLVINQTLATGASLMGSTVPGGIQLGSPRVFMRDLFKKTLKEGLATSAKLVTPNGEFITADEPNLAAQRIYHLYQSFYEITDRYLSVPGEPTLKQWDSHRGDESSFAPGTYQPRIVVFMSSGEKCLNQPACAGSYEVKKLPSPEWIDFGHSANGAEPFEYIGYTHFKNNNIGLNVVAHEFGHVADSFLFPGTAESTACMLEVDCVAKCEEDTPDEAPALTEAVAHLLALLYWYEASNAIDDQDCSAVEWITKHSLKAETPGPCMANLGQIAYMVRGADCPVGDLEFCDKPEGTGTTEVCCDISSDPQCVIMSSECDGKGGGVKLTPTGACSQSPGYRSNSTLEAYWQLLIGQACAPEAPYSCTPMASLGDVTPSEAAARALFYALRVNSRSFRQLFDNIAAYYSCEHGVAAFESVRTVLCTHRIMDCAAPPPMLCGECGNGVLDVGEQCDLTTIPVTCEQLGYDGGEVSCSLTCEVKEDACFHAAPTTGGPTEPFGTTGAATGGQSDPEPGANPASAGTSVGEAYPDGCGCREGGGSRFGSALSLGLLCLAWRSRRRRDP